MASVIKRGVLLAVVLVVGAWLTLGLRATFLEENGEGVLERAQRAQAQDRPPPDGDVVEAGQLELARARRFSPDQGPLISEGLLLTAVGRTEEGQIVAGRVLAKEPDNVQAWYLAYVSATSPENARRALRRVHELNPWLADSLREEARDG